jgi:UDP-glucose 4-epimerase
MAAPEERQTILVTGAAGGLASLVTGLLTSRYRLVGVDPRPLRSSATFPGEFFTVDYRARRMAEIFRQYRFHCVLHLGRIPMAEMAKDSVRYNTNVLGTKNLLELCAKYKVPNVVVCSTFHVYGAHPHNPLYLKEDDPLRASQTFPELIDAVDLDNVSTAFVLKHPEIRGVVLRPANVIGPRIRNRITTFLRSRVCPYLLGYDPPMQFLHEGDVARAIQLALEGSHRGVFNVAGEGVVPFTRAIRLAGATPMPVATHFAYPAARLFTALGMNFPAHLVDYFRYPVVISDMAFRRAFGWKAEMATLDSLRELKGTVPPVENIDATE